MMRESECLVPYPYPYPYAAESNQENPMSALTDSVSLGKFMTESLCWERWSAFTRRKYVEEAQRCAQPGSVAQKKAFFEAHYKGLVAQKSAASEVKILQPNDSTTISVVLIGASGRKVSLDRISISSLESSTTPKTNDSLLQQNSLNIDSASSSKRLSSSPLKASIQVKQGNILPIKENNATQSTNVDKTITMDLVNNKEPDDEIISPTQSLGLDQSSKDRDEDMLGYSIENERMKIPDNPSAAVCTTVHECSALSSKSDGNEPQSLVLSISRIKEIEREFSSNEMQLRKTVKDKTRKRFKILGCVFGCFKPSVIEEDKDERKKVHPVILFDE